MKKPRMFLSHIHEDRSIAVLLAKYVEKAFLKAIEVFVSSDGTSILLGDKWLDRIEGELKGASIVVVLASPDSVARPWINFEAGGGWLRGARVMPVCIRGMQIAALPEPLKSLRACEISSTEGVRVFFEGVGRVLDIECGLSDWKQVAAELSRVQEPEVTASLAQSEEMPETWSPDNLKFSWISDIDDPQLLGIATSLLAVRQACHEKLWYRQKNPNSMWSADQSECRMYSKAVANLRKRYGKGFPFEPLDDGEGYSTNASPGRLLTLCDNVLRFVKRERDSKIA